MQEKTKINLKTVEATIENKISITKKTMINKI